MIIVSDTSPISNLILINQLELLKLIFSFHLQFKPKKVRHFFSPPAVRTGRNDGLF
jgi:predicted nucleic acid-binding protein